MDRTCSNGPRVLDLPATPQPAAPGRTSAEDEPCEIRRVLSGRSPEVLARVREVPPPAPPRYRGSGPEVNS
ncbi:MAG: hypothetical protein U0835_16325 [Isosphaeraceae bacterium]